MGSDCPSYERETRYMSFHQAIYAIENDIKKELYNRDISKKAYQPFGLVNQGLCKKYKFLLNPNFDRNEALKKVFNYNDLVEKNEDKDFSYINANFSFNFPSQFIFINKEFMDLIRDNVPQAYKTHLRTNFDTIIGGGCLLMKNPKDPKDEKPYRYIILYNELKENKGNEIDFFLYIKDRNIRNYHVDLILQNNLYNYFKMINYNYKDEYKKIFDEKNKEIGCIVRCNLDPSIDKYLSKMKTQQFQNPSSVQNFQGNQNLLNAQNNINAQNAFNLQMVQNFKANQNLLNVQNQNNINAQNAFNPQMVQNFQNNQNALNNQQLGSNPNNDEVKNMMKSPTSFPKNSYVKINPELLIDSVVAFFYQIGELTNYLTKNRKLDFPTVKNIIISKAGPNIKTFKNYQQIIEMILTGIDQNSQVNQVNNDQSSQYDEAKGFNKFMEKHKKGNIIQKLFLIPKEEIISCKKCGMKTYQFNYAKFIYIKYPPKEILYQKIFEPQTEHKIKSKSCVFCNGQETESTITTKFLDYPEKLIVIIEPTQVINFNIQLNSVVTMNGFNFSYSLIQFIEAITNNLYLINPNNTLSCRQINKNVNENIAEKKPIVLFYNLIKLDAPINMNKINMQNVPNQMKDRMEIKHQ